MATLPALKLEQGARSLNLNDQARYFMFDDFTPPSINEVVTLASGTSANRTGGSRRIGSRTVDREFSFSVNVVGSSDAEISRAMRDIRSFLDRAGDVADPVYLVFKPNSDTPDPLWGNYGASLRYEILKGDAVLSSDYMVGLNFASFVVATVSLILKPYAIGLRQRLASATGGVLEDTIGTVDGKSRGTRIPEATTNKITNPIFGHSTYSNDWTAANLNTAQNTDKEFILFGNNSAKLVPTGAGTPLYTQSITAGATTHTLSAYVKRVDGGVVDSNVLSLHFNGSTVTPDAYESIGNGWYRARYTATAGAGAANYGVRPISVYGLYLDGVQLEEKAYATPLCHGDLMGCAWTGTAHDSTSSRTAARVRATITAALNFTQFTIRVVWKPDKANTAFTASSPRMFETDTVTFRAYFDFSTDVWTFSDGTNTITSSADTFAAQERIILHFVGSPGSLKIYKNGSEVATGSTYTPPTPPTYLYIGTTSAAAAHAGGTFMDCATFDTALTATQVANDYANVAQLTADDQRVGSIPWLWTKDGDDGVDNCNGSVSGTDRDNFAICGGIPGSASAGLFIRAALSSDLRDVDGIWMSNLALDEFLNPSNLYFDFSGTADVGNSSGDAYQAQTITTSDVYWGSSGTLQSTFEKLAGKEIVLLARMNDTSTTLGLNIALSVLVNSYRTDSGSISITGANAFRLYKTTPIQLYNWRDFIEYGGLVIDSTVSAFSLKTVRGSGSASVQLDYFQVFPSPSVLVDTQSSSLTAGENGFVLDGYKVQSFKTSDNLTTGRFVQLIGDIIELEPDQYNHLITVMGRDTVNPTVTATLTYDWIIILPRWSLL